ncbi:hypothetical protein ACA910_011870 [Epithemia clementina (nom. ined.)]
MDDNNSNVDFGCTDDNDLQSVEHRDSNGIDMEAEMKSPPAGVMQMNTENENNDNNDANSDNSNDIPFAQVLFGDPSSGEDNDDGNEADNGNGNEEDNGDGNEDDSSEDNGDGNEEDSGNGNEEDTG